MRECLQIIFCFRNVGIATANVSELGSSVSIVSGLGWKTGLVEVRSPAEAKGFFL
jgi:hypothetical protein